MSYDREWYDKAEEYWHSVPEFEYLSRSEIEEDYPRWLELLEAIDMGIQPTNTLAWEYFKEEYGWDDEDFNWEEFREWYDSTH